MASTTIVSDLKTVDATAPTALSQTNANAAAGVIVDLVGMQHDALLQALELKKTLAILAAAYDAGDPNLTLVNNDLASLV